MTWLVRFAQLCRAVQEYNMNLSNMQPWDNRKMFEHIERELHWLATGEELTQMSRSE